MYLSLARFRPPSRSQFVSILAAAVVLLLSSCGTRLSGGEAEQQLLTAYGQTGVPGEGGVSDAEGSGAGSGEADRSSGDGATASGDAGPGTGRASGSGGSDGDGDGGDGGGDGGGGASEATGAPIVIGMTGNYSGVIGSAYAPARDAYAAWAKMVNENGGIDGHPISLLIADNQGSPAQDLANAKKFVEEEGAIALVNLFPSGDHDPLEKYARSKNVPIVGGSAYDPIWNESPVMFPALGAVNTWWFGMAKAIDQEGMTKAGAIYCTEAAACKEVEQRWAKEARRLGIDVVYESGASLAQPDYTSQCVEARNRRAQAVMAVMDGASTNRIAQSCDRQGYNPLILSTTPSPKVPSYATNYVAVIPSFPWFLRSGSPALKEYGDAMAQYVSSEPAAYGTTGWVNGKLLEAALSHGVSAKPTSMDVFKGLWAIKNETLGGLTPPITFSKGKPATELPCVYKVVVKSGKWSAPTGVKPSLCR